MVRQLINVRISFKESKRRWRLSNYEGSRRLLIDDRSDDHIFTQPRDYTWTSSSRKWSWNGCVWITESNLRLNPLH